ncbi:hypothetical protein C1G86_1537 [Dehalococcoides mccartyi]|uniref:Uncharacterized protein n=1 Tax=Dehalococcoides mccartyi TaxID=61435 RepID=A0A328ENA4_9CHLR|nr:hypothetical protein C1G87_1574 [Dehalococcoides mccartyi]RAL70013.1 hypothetical protein C1G86_1537 [Dehalococcoides mccartyi]
MVTEVKKPGATLQRIKITSPDHEILIWLLDRANQNVYHMLVCSYVHIDYEVEYDGNKGF